MLIYQAYTSFSLLNNPGGGRFRNFINDCDLRAFLDQSADLRLNRCDQNHSKLYRESF